MSQSYTRLLVFDVFEPLYHFVGVILLVSPGGSPEFLVDVFQESLLSLTLILLG